MIPYGRQNISDADINAVIETLRSDFLTQGPQVPSFENKIAQYCEAKFAVATSNATASLHLACLALGVGKGDIVWTSPISFVASSNCALYCGAEVDFVDVEINTGLMSVTALENKLKQAAEENRLPKVVIPVHLTGQSCDMARISKLAETFNFKVIEDASHAIGSAYKSSPVGNCEYSDICVFSFHPVKIITTGEGGISTTNSNEIAQKLRQLRSHGVVRDPLALSSEEEGAWYYEQRELGFNYRLTDLQAALGASQLTRLDEFVSKRNLLAYRYHELLSELPLSPVEIQEDNYSSYHLFIIRLNNRSIRRKTFDTLKANGVGVNVHYIPIYWQPFYREKGFSKGYCPNAESFYNSIITLPLFPDLTVQEQDQVVKLLRNCL
ncbi:UDP-4-amino-4,6-dideoxy-N-acetyl-beta-L-altrosamine transaminase [Pseudoalteromonas phenolica]|uniref:UDP-4-amino-4, 6-dideoxy-N-acetyl-beta-L-altrosamine transaminase n=1 Tax=Pseudoalteromonas phenolica TaxID=161398 RepID=A0A4Q7IK58_9GAMM|nr:UDP-4-amino-4,6-dideoxy-N-acetyl-beta-L-altrosamine transaminase [Pseudoalteromonas phenolica]RZQ52553.1 UDP-4-amino-4,6-dideoxy-N-acetyl-beta-L-altrosamine transaminase [Pseudoalteromonas phenolica]